MILSFKCQLKSDVVLTSKSATEGFHASLDYIPGSKFLGIVAKRYYDTSESMKNRTLNLFHDGNVKFGNAYPVIDNQISYPIPLSWFEDKMKRKNEIYLHHYLDESIRSQHRKDDIQLRQKRTGFINEEGNLSRDIKQDFSIKSAYEADKRKSKNSNMFGYHALKTGSEFVFEVYIHDSIVDTEIKKIIKEELNGIQKIGRSRSAEYGLVKIEFISEKVDQFISPETKDASRSQFIIYAVSDWCFVDDFGFSTTALSPVHFGFDDTRAEIDWVKSQVKTRLYQTYNNHRRTPNSDLMVIQKGSVVVINTIGAPEGLLSTIGILQSEGLGQVRYNPDFLVSSTAVIDDPKEIIDGHIEHDKYTGISNGELDNLVLQMLERRGVLKDKDKNIEGIVEIFVNTSFTRFQGISKSQWGAISGIAKSTPDAAKLLALLFHKDEKEPSLSIGFLKRGIAAKNWKSCVSLLEDFVNEHPNHLHEVLIKTASKMQKKIDKYGE